MCKQNKPLLCFFSKVLEIILGNFTERRMFGNLEIGRSETGSGFLRVNRRSDAGFLTRIGGTDDIKYPDSSTSALIQKVNDAVEAINDLCNTSDVDINSENINTEMSELLTEAILNTKEGTANRDRLRRISLQFSQISTKMQEISLESRELDGDSVEAKILRYMIEILLKEIFLN